MRNLKIIFLSLSILCFSSFIESHGSLTVYCGSMYSGKTEEAIRFISRQLIANPKIIGVFKPLLDNRKLANNEKDPSKFITSRNGGSVGCIAVAEVAEMKKIIHENNYTIIAIDEAQFFDKQELIKFVHEMLILDKKIIIFGLDLDFKGETFGAMGELLALADQVIKLTAVCSGCGQDTYCITQRIINGVPAHYNDPLIVVGTSQYEPRCRKCHIIRKDAQINADSTKETPASLQQNL
ncbi:MAG: thymidine kinase [Candidatus Dependentiae bacterium]|nr:thymidine kinase [Candidatus Dependentiae bacterium]